MKNTCDLSHNSLAVGFKTQSGGISRNGISQFYVAVTSDLLLSSTDRVFTNALRGPSDRLVGIVASAQTIQQLILHAQLGFKLLNPRFQLVVHALLLFKGSLWLT